MCFLNRVVSLALFKLIGVAPWFSFPGFAKEVLNKNVNAASVVSSHPYKSKMLLKAHIAMCFTIFNWNMKLLKMRNYNLFLARVNYWAKSRLNQRYFLKRHWCGQMHKENKNASDARKIVAWSCTLHLTFFNQTRCLQNMTVGTFH